MSTDKPTCICPPGLESIGCPIHGEEAMPEAWGTPDKPSLPEPIPLLNRTEDTVILSETVNKLIAYLEARDGR